LIIGGAPSSRPAPFHPTNLSIHTLMKIPSCEPPSLPFLISFVRLYEAWKPHPFVLAYDLCGVAHFLKRGVFIFLGFSPCSEGPFFFFLFSSPSIFFFYSIDDLFPPAFSTIHLDVSCGFPELPLSLLPICAPYPVPLSKVISFFFT